MIGVEKKTTNRVVIPASVKINGKAYAVTEIAKNALKGNRKITSLTIGKNVVKIGKNAMKDCKNLKKVTIKSIKIKSIGANAWKGINKKAVIKLPKKKKSMYKKMLKKAGISR